MDSHPHYTQRCTLEEWHIRLERNRLYKDVGPLTSTYTLSFVLLNPPQSLLPTIYRTFRLLTINITQLHIQLSPLLSCPLHYLPSRPRHLHTYKKCLPCIQIITTDDDPWIGVETWSIDKSKCPIPAQLVWYQRLY